MSMATICVTMNSVPTTAGTFGKRIKIKIKINKNKMKRNETTKRNEKLVQSCTPLAHISQTMVATVKPSIPDAPPGEA